MGAIHQVGYEQVRKMLLKAKIKAEYLDKIIDGEKTMEFRQFTGDDILNLFDENGRSKDMRIVGIHEASEEMAADVMKKHSDVQWDEGEPIIVIKLAPL